MVLTFFRKDVGVYNLAEFYLLILSKSSASYGKIGDQRSDPLLVSNKFQFNFQLDNFT